MFNISTNVEGLLRGHFISNSPNSMSSKQKRDHLMSRDLMSCSQKRFKFKLISNYLLQIIK